MHHKTSQREQEHARLYRNVWSNYGGRFWAFLAYFPSISHLFLHYFPKNFPFPNYFPVISHLFHCYFSFLNNFSLISHLFLIYRRCSSFLSYTSQLFLSYFSVTSRLFPSESADISAIYNWLISALTSRRLLHGVTIKSE